MWMFWIAIAVSHTLYAQSSAEADLFREWESAVYQQAATGKAVAFLQPKEKELLRLINLARLNPSLFAKTYLTYYGNTLDSLGLPKAQAQLHAIAAQYSSLPPLMPVIGLQKAAMLKIRLEQTGQSSQGTVPFYDRIHQFFPGARRYATESLLGDGDPTVLVTRLLLDSSASFRWHILSPHLQYIGLSIQPDAAACFRLAMDFASQPFPPQPVQNRTRIKQKDYSDECPDGGKIRKVKRRKKRRFLFF